MQSASVLSIVTGAVKNQSKNRDCYLHPGKMFAMLEIHPRRPESGSPAAQDYFYL